jgi:hypothetical protein
MEPYSAMQTGAQHERDRLRLLLETRRDMLVSANPRGTTSRVAEIDRMLNMLQPEPRRPGQLLPPAMTQV